MFFSAYEKPFVLQKAHKIGETQDKVDTAPKTPRRGHRLEDTDEEGCKEFQV